MAFAALASGVSGLKAFTDGIGVISDNITNVNTVGYKESRTRFTTLVTETQGSRYSPGGVRGSVHTLISEQGLLNASSSATDLGIDGKGFFIVRTAASANAAEGSFEFTRAGNFTRDDEGFLRNASGRFLMGFPMDLNGNIPTNIGDLDTMVPINIDALTGTAEATSRVGLRMNLQNTLPVVAGPVAPGDMAAGTVPAQFEQTITVFDAQGTSQELTLATVKTGINQFRFEVYAQDPLAINAADGGLVMSGDLQFNSDGSVQQYNRDFPAPAIAIAPPAGEPLEPAVDLLFENGAGTETVTFDLGTVGNTDGLTQFDSESFLQASSINGAIFGNVIGVDVAADGVVTALFDNGLSRDVFQLPIATFPNADGLTRLQGNAYGESAESGNFAVVLPGTGGGGRISPSSLESSTVDLSEEFADLIVTQRSFSAATRIITTSDEILEELVRI